MPEYATKIFLFDLGGVLFELNDPDRTFNLDAGHDNFHERWLMSPSVRDFERGALTNENFARRIVVEAELDYDAEEFLRRFDAWPQRFYPGALELVETLSRHYAVAVLSNTNAMHWDREDIGGQLEHKLFRVFLSYRTGNLKPDENAFAEVCKDLRCEPGEILFFDDNPLNVAAASGFGIRAELANGIDAVKRILEKYEI